MARPRLRLHDILTELIESEDISKEQVYFQPPASLRMKYPCIRYKLNDADTIFADNNPYVRHKRYEVVVIDPDPDSKIPDKISNLPMCLFDRHYTSDNLNHFVFKIYY